MLPFDLGMPELLIILGICLLIFGPRQLPRLGRGLGETLREWRKAANELHGDDDSPTPPHS